MVLHPSRWLSNSSAGRSWWNSSTTVSDPSAVSTTSTVVEPGGSEPLPATPQVKTTRRGGATSTYSPRTGVLLMSRGRSAGHTGASTYAVVMSVAGSALLQPWAAHACSELTLVKPGNLDGHEIYADAPKLAQPAGPAPGGRGMGSDPQ